MKIDKILTDTIFWLNPILAFGEFNQLNRSKKLQAIAATAFATIALTYSGGVCGLSGYVVFRLTVNHLKKRHPAEQPVGRDILTSLPQEIILKILNDCDKNSLAKLEISCKYFLNTIENNAVWEMMAKKTLGGAGAGLFIRDRSNWKQVMSDLKKPVEVKTSELSEAFQFDILGKQTNFNLPMRAKWLYNLAKQANPVALKIGLEESLGSHQLINAPFLERHLLMYRWQPTPLVAAASAGKIENMQILINHGAKPGTILEPNGKRTSSSRAFYLKLVSPLFAAACHKQTQAVAFLLEKGAKIEAPIQFFQVLMDQYEIFPSCDDNKECLNCMLLLLKAAKAQSPSNFHAILDACTEEALKGGFINHLHLLLALGAEFKRQRFYPNTDNFNLLMIKFCHQHKVINLVDWRGRHSEETLLHHCIAYDKPDVLDFLLSIGVPQEVLNVNGESYRESGSRKLKERILNEIALNIKYYKKPRSVIQCELISKQPLKDCLKYNFNLNEGRDNAGNTLLHHAVEAILIDTDLVIAQLLTHGANPFLENHAHQTPLSRAKQILESRASEASAAQLAYAHALIQTMQNKAQYSNTHG